MNHSIKITIGYVQAKHEDIVKDLVEPLSAIGRTDRHQFPMLAGPNEVIQIILDPHSWVAFTQLAHHVLHVAEPILVSKVLEKAWGRLTRASKEKTDQAAVAGLEEFATRLVTRMNDTARKPPVTYVLALPSPQPGRNFGLQLTGHTRDEVMRQIVLFGIQAPEIEHAFITYKVDVDANQTLLTANEDCSVRVVLDENGAFSFPTQKGGRWPPSGEGE